MQKTVITLNGNVIFEGPLSKWPKSDKLPAGAIQETLDMTLAVDGNWYLTSDYASLRKPEYPSQYDYLDGIVKGDTDQVKKYIQDCLDVKAKYPKPE